MLRSSVKVMKGKRCGCKIVPRLSDVFEIPHGEVDCHQACVDAAAGRDPDGTVGVK